MLEIQVVGAAIRDGDKILAAKRSEDMSNAFKWEFVGGKVEENETNEQALKREVNEELGIDIKVKEQIAIGYSEIKGNKIVLHIYEAEIIKGIPVASEHSKLEWVSIKDLMKRDWAEADIPACEKLISLYCCS